MIAPAFASFFMAGFESACHRRRDGVRLDLIRATAHDRHAASDYAACRSLGFLTLRDALRWHRIEEVADRFDWSSWQSMLEAGATAGVEIIWTLHHYGMPDHIDPSAEDFPDRFARFAAAAAVHHRAVTGRPGIFCPVNEISFFAWAVGKRYFPVRGMANAGAAKRQLVKAALAAARAMRAVDAQCGLFWSEPLIHVAPRSGDRAERGRAEVYRLAQFEAYDMLTGRLAPELGGREELVPRIGLNFYPHNQFYCEGSTIPLGHHAYRALGDMLVEVAQRYGRPLIISETGAEGTAQAAWLHYVVDEVRDACRRGASVEGLCLYPVTHYPGWDNGRRIITGLFSDPGADGRREIDHRLLDEICRQRELPSQTGGGPQLGANARGTLS